MKRHRRYAVRATWDGWGSIPVVVFPGMAGQRVPPYVRRLFPSKVNRQISERDPVEPGGQELGSGSRNLRAKGVAKDVLGRGSYLNRSVPSQGRAVSRERLGDWDGPIEV